MLKYSQERKDAALIELMLPQNYRPKDVTAEDGITKNSAYCRRREAAAGASDFMWYGKRPCAAGHIENENKGS